MHTCEVGLDMIGIARIERAASRWGERFLHRVFSERELQQCRGRAESLAARFAAKEALLKALGTGLMRGIRWTDVEILHNSAGAPYVTLHGMAATIAQKKGLDHWRVSLTHSDDMAAAMVVGWGCQDDDKFLK